VFTIVFEEQFCFSKDQNGDVLEDLYVLRTLEDCLQFFISIKSADDNDYYKISNFRHTLIEITANDIQSAIKHVKKGGGKPQCVLWVSSLLRNW